MSIPAKHLLMQRMQETRLLSKGVCIPALCRVAAHNNRGFHLALLVCRLLRQELQLCSIFAFENRTVSVQLANLDSSLTLWIFRFGDVIRCSRRQSVLDARRIRSLFFQLDPEWHGKLDSHLIFHFGPYRKGLSIALHSCLHPQIYGRRVLIVGLIEWWVWLFEFPTRC